MHGEINLILSINIDTMNICLKNCYAIKILFELRHLFCFLIWVLIVHARGNQFVPDTMHT